MSSNTEVTEIIASSNKNFDDAIKQGINRADETLENIKGAWIDHQQIKVDGQGKVSEYRINLKVSLSPIPDHPLEKRDGPAMFA